MRLAIPVAVFVILAAVSAATFAQQPSTGDWPQFRGPTRDGIAPAGPKLADTWPEGGPKLLWKTEGIPSGPDGGVGSIVVADGRAFVYVNSRRPKSPTGKAVLTAEALAELGWVAGMPDDLAAKLEAARLSDKRAGLTGAQLKAFIDEFLSTLERDRATRFRAQIQDRLTRGRDALPWEALVKLAALQDKAFPAIDDTFKESMKTGG